MHRFGLHEVRTTACIHALAPCVDFKFDILDFEIKIKNYLRSSRTMDRPNLIKIHLRVMCQLNECVHYTTN